MKKLARNIIIARNHFHKKWQELIKPLLNVKYELDNKIHFTNDLAAKGYLIGEIVLILTVVTRDDTKSRQTNAWSFELFKILHDLQRYPYLFRKNEITKREKIAKHVLFDKLNLKATSLFNKLAVSANARIPIIMKRESLDMYELEPLTIANPEIWIGSYRKILDYVVTFIYEDNHPDTDEFIRKIKNI